MTELLGAASLLVCEPALEALSAQAAGSGRPTLAPRRQGLMEHPR